MPAFQRYGALVLRHLFLNMVKLSRSTNTKNSKYVSNSLINFNTTFLQSLDGDKRCEDPVMPSYIEPLLNCTVPIPMYSNVTLNEGGYSLIGEEDKAISQTTLPVAPPEGANWASANDQGLQLTGQRSFWIFEHLDTTLA